MAFQAIPGVPEGALSPSPATRTFDPYLLPRWYLALASTATQSGVDQLVAASPEAFLAANPRADATGGAMTFTGSPGAADLATVTLTNKLFPGSAIVLVYTVSGTPSVTVVAAGVAAMINDSQLCRAFGINASSLAGVVTVTHNGPVGNYTVLSCVASQVGGTIAVAVASSGAFTGGSGPVVPLSTFSAFPESAQGVTLTMQFIYGRPVAIGSAVLKSLNAAGLPLG